MGHDPFTLFNGITLFLLVLTAMLAWQRFRGSLTSNWPLVYYVMIAGYALGFRGALNPYWIAAGVACALAIRFGLYPSRARLVEAIALGYVAWRCVGLLLMW